jgi:beta-galactosidase
MPIRNALVLWAALSLPAAAQVKLDTILYGVSYYHEYMPYERLDKDVALMEKAGINVVRVGESTWSSFEPQDGHFEFAWMGRILDRMHEAGIKVILGTPTYSIPPWLYHKHPEILVTRLGEQKSYYGIRQNMDITHPTYRFYAERVIRQVVGHFKDHPAVIGYQVDNETSSYGTAGRNVQLAFVEYLKRKFHTTAELNKQWGFVYWGQLVNDWEELPPRDGILNPGYKLEWERFQRGLATEFLGWQADIVNQYKRPGQFVTHDFSQGPHSDIDMWAIARRMDMVATNNYHDVQDALDGRSPALVNSIARSVGKGNFLLTETNAQGTGWDSKHQMAPYDGQLRLSVYGHLGDGADMVAYWHWHSLHYGQETYWRGVLSHDLEPNRTYAEVSRIAHELQRVGPRLVNLRKQAPVAILFSIDSLQDLKFMPFSDKVDYMTLVRQFHGALYRLKVETDFVDEEADWSRYRMLVVPPLYVASDATLQKVAKYVAAGGHVVLSFKSGFTNEYSTVRWVRAPGPLREAAGFSYQEFSTLTKPMALKGDPFQAGAGNEVSTWAEMLVPETAKPLAWYDHPFFGKSPAITRNAFGKGTLTYEGTVLSDGLQERVLRQELDLAGLIGPDQGLPAAIAVKHGTTADGKKLHYLLNYSGGAQAFKSPVGGKDLLSGRGITAGGQIELAAWDVAIVEER